MKFLLRHDLGQWAIKEIGHHWIEKHRDDIFVHVVHDVDEAILREDLSESLEPLDAEEGSGTQH